MQRRTRTQQRDRRLQRWPTGLPLLLLCIPRNSYSFRRHSFGCLLFHYILQFQTRPVESCQNRTLLHPHVDEQPFTRSLGGVAIPSDVSRVTVRAGDSVHKYGGHEVLVDLPR